MSNIYSLFTLFSGIDLLYKWRTLTTFMLEALPLHGIRVVSEILAKISLQAIYIMVDSSPTSCFCLIRWRTWSLSNSLPHISSCGIDHQIVPLLESQDLMCYLCGISPAPLSLDSSGYWSVSESYWRNGTHMIIILYSILFMPLSLRNVWLDLSKNKRSKWIRKRKFFFKKYIFFNEFKSLKFLLILF